MTDANPSDPRDPMNDAEVSAGELLAFVRSRNYLCEICGSNSWYVTTAPDGASAVSVVWKPAHVTDGGYDLISYPVMCINCGNTKTFNKLLIKYALNEWRDKKFGRMGSADE